MKVSLVGPIVFALLLPALVYFSVQILGRGLSIFVAQAEIDRVLRATAGTRLQLWWRPWIRESLAVRAWRRMSPGPSRDEFGRLLVRHGRAMDLQVGFSTTMTLGLLLAWGAHFRVWGAVLLLAALQISWRWRRRRELRSCSGAEG